MFTIISGLLTAYGVFSLLAYRRYNPSRLWVPMLCSAAYTVINIDGWLSWPAVIVTVILFLSWRKRSNGVDTGYRVIADLTSGRFGVPRQKTNESPVTVTDEPATVADNTNAPETEVNDTTDRFAPPAEESGSGSGSSTMYRCRGVGQYPTSTFIFRYSSI